MSTSPTYEQFKPRYAELASGGRYKEASLGEKIVNLFNKTPKPAESEVNVLDLMDDRHENSRVLQKDKGRLEALYQDADFRQQVKWLLGDVGKGSLKLQDFIQEYDSLLKDWEIANRQSHREIASKPYSSSLHVSGTESVSKNDEGSIKVENVGQKSSLNSEFVNHSPSEGSLTIEHVTSKVQEAHWAVDKKTGDLTWVDPSSNLSADKALSNLKAGLSSGQGTLSSSSANAKIASALSGVQSDAESELLNQPNRQPQTRRKI